MINQVMKYGFFLFSDIILLDTTNDNIPFKSELSSSNPETQYKINLRSESEITTMTTDTNTQLAQSNESGILIFSNILSLRILLSR